VSDYTKADYWANVEELAQEYNAKEGQRDYDLGETVDETQWIIYNAGNYAIIKYTNNEDAIFDELGGDAGECYSGASCFQQVVQWTASWAMQADVLERARLIKQEQGE